MQKKFVTNFVTAVTNFLTHVTNFVIRVTNFVIHVTNFVIKTLLYEWKKFQGGREKYLRDSKNFHAESESRLIR